MRFEGFDIERAMVVYAHPDDAEFGLAGTIAKWARAGVEITYCMVTNGASGSDDPDITREELRELRYAEQREAARILGVKHCVFLGYEDGYLYPTLEVRKDVARQIRIHRPDVLFTMDPTTRIAGDFYVNHPDHMAAGEVALRSINPDASTRQMFPELWRDEHLEPHKPKLLLLQSFGEGGTVVDITATLETKVTALLVHRSQLGADAEALVRDFAARIGKAGGYKAGESFRVVRLERPPSGAARASRATARSVKPSRPSRGSRGVQRQRRTSTRARTKGTPSRRKRAR
jgi:LmbE family N-acetylglucosaminyl deacetylase